MKVSIVIPNWNGSERLKKKLPKVLTAAREAKITEVIVSDDASTDDSIATLKSEFPEVVLVERKSNGGFSSNVNSGFKQTSADLVVLLNNDAYPKLGFLDYVLPHFSNPLVFSVGCRVGDGLWSVGKFTQGYFWHGQPQKSSILRDSDPEGERPFETKAHQTLWASGGSSIFRKSLWDELGGLDTLFDPFYEEDLDLGYRATKRGYINIWEPRAEVLHYQEKGVIESNFSKDQVSKIAQRNQLIFIWKNITDKKMVSDHQKALAKMLLTHPKYWEIFLSALAKYPQIMAKRKIEEQAAKLTDEEIFAIFAADRI